LQVGHVKSLSFKAGLKKESKKIKKIKRKIVAVGQRKTQNKLCSGTQHKTIYPPG
jgi:hypothetical protein